ncbi:MAG: alpha/beta hydrolase [Spirochaetae bacterium HGW-Spirochaetae-5]|nr:MAG: alpha/beta hydrolase [Spirochaetae bacterium HGW-Spirochaetae-5]
MNLSKILKKLKVAIISILLIILLLVISVFTLIFINSSGEPVPFLDENGKILPSSISEKNYIEVDGGKLGFYIKGKNKNNPILLFLHGGMPFYFITQDFPTGLDEIFTVVWWDQRGAGISYDAWHKDITADDLINDTKAITDYLRNRFSQDKIYLMAHSGGSFLAVKVITRYPDLYKAYIAVAQIAYQKLSEKKASEYIIEHYRNDKSKRNIVQSLIDHPIILTEPIPEEYTKVRDSAMHDLGVGTMHNMKGVITGIFVPSLLFNEYSLKDKINLWKGKATSGISVMWNEIISQDLAKENTKFEMPVYFFHGIFDYTCSYQLAKEYFDVIKAPEKVFFTFNNSAHSPIFEEPLESINIIKTKILKKN